MDERTQILAGAAAEVHCEILFQYKILVGVLKVCDEIPESVKKTSIAHDETKRVHQV